MKTLSVVAVLFALFACAEGAPKKIEVTSSSVKKTEIDSVNTQVEKQSDLEMEPTLLPTDGKFSCNDLGEIDYVPVYEVCVSFQGEKHIIGKCNACLDIPNGEYIDHEIPINAIAARGGWYAGGGDYFYSIEDGDGNLSIYQGWQDEGQVEDDFSFHWKLIKTFKLK